MRGSRHIGFRIKPYVDDGGTSNGGRYPVRGETRCPTFRVLHNDSIGRLVLPKGTYNVWVRGRLSCSASTRLFDQFLDDPTGDLPTPWVVNAAERELLARPRQLDRLPRQAGQVVNPAYGCAGARRAPRAPSAVLPRSPSGSARAARAAPRAAAR